MLLQGVIGAPLQTMAMIVGCLLLQSFCIGKIQGTLAALLLTVLQIFPRMLFLRMLGISLTRTMRIGEMVETLEQLRIPQTIVIPFAVMIRFLPTLSKEIHCICDSLKIRGIDYSIRGFVNSPLRWLEYLIVPILMRSARLSDELAATALVRGIENRFINENVRERIVNE